MKVLFLSTKEGLTETGRSAYTHRIAKLCEALDHAGFETTYIGMRDYPFSRPVLLQPLNFPWVRQLISGYDVIHAGQDASYIAGLWSLYTGAQVLFDCHGDTFGEAHLECLFHPGGGSNYYLLQTMMVNAVGHRMATHHLIVSKPMRQWLMDEWHIPPDRMTMIRNGVDLTLFDRPATVPDGPFVVCYAGGFDTWQGIDNLVRAFELLPPNLNVRLKIIGFGENQADIKASIARRVGERADLIDRVSQQALIEHLAAAHMLVIPRSQHRAMYVALPTKFAEYLGLRKPVLVCDVDETADLIREHRCGMVCDANPAALAQAIEHASHLSRAELIEMGENGRALAEREFSWDIIGQNYAKLLSTWRR